MGDNWLAALPTKSTHVNGILDTGQTDESENAHMREHLGTYLDRYLRGEHEQVWAELVALGELDAAQPLAAETYADAAAVAHETMRRVRYNLDLLIPRLRELGYAFGYGWAIARGVLSPEAAAQWEQDEPPLSPPEGDLVSVIAELERRTGALPLSLRAFYEIVGGCNFVGAHPHWDSHRLDPLRVLSAHAVLRLDDENHWSDDRRDDGRYELPIAPDEYFKYLYSGGGPYVLPLTGVVADAPLVYEWHDTTFVNYLRTCFRWGGFPGWERMPAVVPKPTLAILTEGLLPM